MQTPSIHRVLLALLAASGLAFAGNPPIVANMSIKELTLKDGTVLKGVKVLKVGADSYEVEYRFSASIIERKTIRKVDVVKVDAELPGEKEFAAIVGLVPTPDFLTAADYQARVGAVQAYLKKFPTSPKLAEANAVLGKLQEELTVVAAGGAKYQNLMVSGADYKANAYDMDARAIVTRIETAIKAGQSIAALRAFADLDRDFQASTCYREVVPAVVRVMTALRGQVAASLSTFDARMEKRAADMERMDGVERANTQKALDERAAGLESLYQAEKSAGQVWVTPNEEHKGSLEDTNSMLDSELSRLASPAEAGDAGKAFRNAWRLIRNKADQESVDKALSEASSANLPEKYQKILEAAVKEVGIKPAGE